jgi:hypothetical protein
MQFYGSAVMQVVQAEYPPEGGDDVPISFANMSSFIFLNLAVYLRERREMSKSKIPQGRTDRKPSGFHKNECYFFT